jgi:hypothetical protein
VIRLADETFALRSTLDGIDVRRLAADRPAAFAETDIQTLRTLSTGLRCVADACRRGELRLDGCAGARRVGRMLSES